MKRKKVSKKYSNKEIDEAAIGAASYLLHRAIDILPIFYKPLRTKYIKRDKLMIPLLCSDVLDFAINLTEEEQGIESK